MSLTLTTGALVDYFGGASRPDSITRWIQDLQMGHDAIGAVERHPSTAHWATAYWSTPGVRHQMWVKPQQTSTSYADLQDIFVHVVCHVLIDSLPLRALSELVPKLAKMRLAYYPDVPLLVSGEIEIPDAHASPDSANRFIERLAKVRPNRQTEYLDLHEEE